MAAGCNPIVLRKGMHKATRCRCGCIVKMSKPINGKEQIAESQPISASSEEVGGMVADAMEKVYQQRRHHDRREQDHEDGAGSRRRHAVRPRLYFRLYVHRYGEDGSNLDDPYILIVDKKISSIQEILPLLEEDRKERSKAPDHCGRRGRRSTDHPDRQQAERHVQCRCRQGTGLRRQKKRNASGYRHPDRRTGHFRSELGLELKDAKMAQLGQSKIRQGPEGKHDHRRRTREEERHADRVAQIKQQIAETKSISTRKNCRNVLQSCPAA
jgi:chaperonin GroEL